MGIRDKLTPAENPRARSDKSGTELYDNVKEVKDVVERTIDGNGIGGFVISGHTGLFADERDEEVKRIDEKRDETGKEEDIVPAVYDIAIWIKNLTPPWHITRIRLVLQRLMEMTEVIHRPCKYFSHLPWRTPIL